MSGLFEERERGYEAKWAHDQEIHFRVMARRDGLVGRWAAGLMKVGADAYAEEVVSAGMRGKDDPVFRKIRDDFKASNIACSDQEIHRKMTECFDRAGDEIAGPKNTTGDSRPAMAQGIKP